MAVFVFTLQRRVDNLRFQLCSVLLSDITAAYQGFYIIGEQICCIEVDDLVTGIAEQCGCGFVEIHRVVVLIEAHQRALVEVEQSLQVIGTHPYVIRHGIEGVCQHMDLAQAFVVHGQVKVPMCHLVHIFDHTLHRGKQETMEQPQSEHQGGQRQQQEAGDSHVSCLVHLGVQCFDVLVSDDGECILFI